MGARANIRMKYVDGDVCIYSHWGGEELRDVQGKRPGFTDMVGRAKYDAWSALSGTGEDDAMQQYVDLVNSLK